VDLHVCCDRITRVPKKKKKKSSNCASGFKTNVMYMIPNGCFVRLVNRNFHITALKSVIYEIWLS
jgi:hypothetical protein